MTVSRKQTGTVYLVGAGPGHPGLITRWGYELLQQCDAVAYDALIPMELISGLPERVERHYVGKRAGRHSLPQPEINHLLVRLAKRGLNVVRLKGGDPFVFGRIGEEAKHLCDSGIPVVMVPGVTAASAAAAMSGFSLTARQESSWIFIATGHPAENTATPVPWDRVAALPGGTLVIYMGIARLDSIVDQLLVSGMKPETPAVVVHAASTGMQRSVQAPLNRICSECRKHRMKPPALVIVGEPIHGRMSSRKTDSPSLAGIRVLLTGPFRRTEGIASALRKAGAQPIPYPTVVDHPCMEAGEWRQFLDILETGGICFFRRDIDVHHFMDCLMQQGLDLRSLSKIRTAALGASVASAMHSRGIRADCTIQSLKTSSFLEGISKLSSGAPLPLIWPREKQEIPEQEDRLRKQCSVWLSLTVREEVPAAWDPRWEDELKQDAPDYMVFTGVPEIIGFMELLSMETATDLARRSSIVAINNSVATKLEQYELSCSILLDDPQNTDIVKQLAKHVKNRSRK